MNRKIGARIRGLRRFRGWTQKELGARAGLDFTTIGAAERGQKCLSLRSLQRVAAALETDVEWLVRSRNNCTPRTDTEELVEQLLCLVRDLEYHDLKHVVALVQTEREHLPPPTHGFR